MSPPRLLFLLDFDGTLCEPAPRPDLARLSSYRRALLRALNREGRRVAILTGRSLRDIRARVAVPSFIYGGNFGLVLKGPGVSFVHPRARRAALPGLAFRLERAVCGMPRVFVEKKDLSLTLHYRGMPPALATELERRLSPFRARAKDLGLRWQKGDDAWEILPGVDWDKGDAALYLWRSLGQPYLVAIGNNGTDEPLFRAVRGRGLAIRVGEQGSSAAGWRVAGVSEVYPLLQRLKCCANPVAEVASISRAVRAWAWADPSAS